MYSKLNSMGVWGIKAYKVDVETNISTGMPCFDVVGLPDASVRESRERVRSAFKNSGFKFPVSRIVVNLAPADIKKEGSVYDLPILLGLLLASGEADFCTTDSVFVGELSLQGDIRPVNGLLSMAIEAKNLGLKNLYVPESIAVQAAVVKEVNVYPVKNVKQLVKHLQGEEKINKIENPVITLENDSEYLDFADVAGQEYAKRAVEIACAGGHNVLLIGPPGSGKSMIAKRIPSILPDMTFAEAVSTSAIHSVAGKLDNKKPMVTSRPFRSPHHSISVPALAGGGTNPAPGEISLAHNGVIFLDELPEFPKSAMEALRQPLEDGYVTVSRVAGTISYPCNVMFVAAMNPCPCGFFGHPTKTCTCSRNAVQKYLNKVSGPMLDRIDIQIEVPPVKYEELSTSSNSESSADIRKRVNNARKIQLERFKDEGIICNSQMSAAMLKKYCKLDCDANNYLKKSFDMLALSGRAYDRILKLARTIADLDNDSDILKKHIAQALQLRTLDRKYWNN